LSESRKPRPEKEKKQNKKSTVPFPSNDEILKFICGADTKVGKREIASAFNLTGQDKITLKAVLKTLAVGGKFVAGQDKAPGAQAPLPRIDVLEITGTDKDGGLLAKPVKW